MSTLSDVTKLKTSEVVDEVIGLIDDTCVPKGSGVRLLFDMHQFARLHELLIELNDRARNAEAAHA